MCMHKINLGQHVYAVAKSRSDVYAVTKSRPTCVCSN